MRRKADGALGKTVPMLPPSINISSYSRQETMGRNGTIFLCQLRSGRYSRQYQNVGYTSLYFQTINLTAFQYQP